MQSKKQTLTALAAAAALLSSQAALAEIELANENGLKVYAEMKTESKFVIESLNPADQNTTDFWDNKFEPAIGVTYGNWEAYTSFKFNRYEDDDGSRDRTNGRDGLQTEVKDAFVEYDDDLVRLRAGRWGHTLGSTVFWSEELTGAMAGTQLGAFDLVAGVGTETETEDDGVDGDAFGDDSTLAWVEAGFGDFYAFNALWKEGDDDRYNFALGWEGKLGGVGLELEANQQYGEDEDGNDYKGFALVGEASFDLGGLKPKLAFAYASGDDDPNDTDNDGFAAADSFYKPDIVLIDTGAIENGPASNNTDRRSIENLTFVQLSNKFKMNNVWSLTPAVGYYMLTEENAFGEDEVGIEVDLFSVWKFNKYFATFADFGYVFSGDALGEEDLYRTELGMVVKF
jgi:hypothetical protein